jgi:hypothetical protein
MEGSLHDGAGHRDLDGEEIAEYEDLHLSGIHPVEAADRGRVSER